MRLFTAIDLPAPMRETFGAFLDLLRPQAKLRWSSLENLHITTKFIGEWPEDRIKEMKHALSTVPPTGSIPISVRGVDWFGSKVFFAGVEAGEALANLAHSTEFAVAALGVPVEKRTYTPHLTLARVGQGPAPLIETGHPDFGSFHASSFHLYLSSNGKYSKLAEFTLNP